MLDSVRQTHCFHCQAVNPAGATVSVEIDGVEQPVCCMGCLAAVKFIQELNLDSFYKYRETCGANAALQQNPKTPGAEELGSVVSVLENGQRQINLLIPDIRCVACVWLLEQALLQQPGIVSVQVNFASKRMQAVFSDAIEAIDIARAVQKLGYEARPDHPDVARESFQSSRRSMLNRMGVAGIGMMPVMMFAIASYMAGPATAQNPASGMDPLFETLLRWASLALTTPIVLYSAWPFHRGAWFALRNRNLTMDLPVSGAILAAWLLSIHSTLTFGAEVYFDTACMFTFFLLIGRYLELVSRYHFQESQDQLTHLLPTTVRRLTASEGAQEIIKHSAIQLQDRLCVSAGQIIPVDGILEQGSCSVSETAFTGEPVPLSKVPGDRVLAGSLNHDGELLIRVSTAPGNFLIQQICRLQEQAANYRPRWAQLADRTAPWFVAATLLLALAAGLYWYSAGASNFAVIALTVLVVACPCALSLATPVAYTIATTTLRRVGIVIKNGAFLERAASTTAVVFDKTGTLTKANLHIEQVIPLVAELDAQTCLQMATALERISEHPIAHAFNSVTPYQVTEAKIVPGSGVEGVIDGVQYRIGQASFALGNAAAYPPPDKDGLWIVLASARPLAWFRLQDQLRDEAQQVVHSLNSQAYLTAIFSGDSSGDGKRLGESLHATTLTMQMSPADKVAGVRKLGDLGHCVMMLGDGINDTGAMAAANTSIAVSPRDTLVQTSADAVLLNPSLLLIPAALRFAQKCRRIIRQNISWSLVYNFSVIPLAVAGLLPPWLAALGMSLSSLLVVLNAGRLRWMEA